MTRNDGFLFVKPVKSPLRASPEGYQSRNQQPKQSLQEEEEKTPEAESFDPLSHAHIRIASILTEPFLFWLSVFVGRTVSKNFLIR